MATEPMMMAALLQNLGAFCNLDSSDNRCALEGTFAWIREEFPAQARTEFRVIVEGAPRALEPSIREEAHLIVREALCNAFRHAHGSRIEVEVEYSASYLRVLIRDNGSGFNAGVGESLGGSRWGLWKMKELAKRIGARLKILSRAGAGTEVELLVPARIAFGKSEMIGTRWFSRLYS
jgi:signal transduction histidine kinase